MQHLRKGRGVWARILELFEGPECEICANRL